MLITNFVFVKIYKVCLFIFVGIMQKYVAYLLYSLKNIFAKIMSLITKLCVYYMKVCLKNKINYDII